MLQGRQRVPMSQPDDAKHFFAADTFSRENGVVLDEVGIGRAVVSMEV